MKYKIEIFKIGFPCKVLAIFYLRFDSHYDATDFAINTIQKGQRFIIEQKDN